MVLAGKNFLKSPLQIQNNPTPKEPGKDLSTWMHYGMRPGEHPAKRVGRGTEEQPRQVGGKETGKLKHDPDSISDIDYREIPDEPNEPEEPKQLGWKRKPKFKYRHKAGIKEAIEDKAGPELDEKDVEMIFNMLSSGGEKSDPGATASPPETRGAGERKEVSPEEKIAKKQQDMNKIRHLIRDTLTSGQRKALWRALNEI